MQQNFKLPLEVYRLVYKGYVAGDDGLFVSSRGAWWCEMYSTRGSTTTTGRQQYRRMYNAGSEIAPQDKLIRCCMGGTLAFLCGLLKWQHELRCIRARDYSGRSHEMISLQWREQRGRIIFNSMKEINYMCLSGLLIFYETFSTG